MDPVTGYLVQFLIGLALSAVSTLAQQAFAPKQQKQLPGMRSQYSTGGTRPMTIVLGTYGVAGQLEYSNTWGNAGETPNAYLADVISLSDYRITEVSAMWIDSKPVTLSTEDELTRGFPIPEFEQGSVTYAYYRHYLGDQDEASAYLLTVFGADSERPWLSDMIGEGIAYAIQTARIHPTRWSGDFPRYVYEVQGAPVFDPRESTASGGDGDQVWGTFSTYAFSDNLAVLALNVLLGIHDPAGNHIWGGRATLAQFDYANLEAAMDRCDDAIALKGGGTERRYRGGIEISLNERPADVLRDIMVAANMRISYARGKYWFLVDVPDEADASFTDGDLLIEEPIDFSWFPNLDDAVNGAIATFLAPERAWEERPTTPYYRSDLEAEDHGQLHREKLQLRCVFSGSQAQRIVKAVVEEARRFKRHVVCLPDTYRNYRPLQCLAWTSDEFQYSSKLFLILSRTEDEWGRIWFALQEIDPADFEWDAETDETTLTFASTEESPIPSQAVAGWAVEPWSDGDRRPGIHLEWTGALDDIRVVRVQVRHDGETLPLLDREYPYEAGEETQDIYISGDPLLRLTPYEARARFIPFDGSGRDTSWSSWLAVTTPDVGIGLLDIAADIAAWQQRAANSIREVRDNLHQIDQLIADGMARERLDVATVREEVATRFGDVTSEYTHLIEVVSAEGLAVARRVESIEVAIPGLATVAITDTLAAAITVNEDGITALGIRATDLEATVNDPVTGVAATVTALSSLQVQVNTVETTANGRNRVFRQTSAPTATAIGDLWIDTDDDNKLYYATATGTGSWVLSDDQRIPATVTATATNASAITALQGQLGNTGANTVFRLDATYTPSAGWTSAIALMASVTAGGTSYNAGLFLEAKTGSARVVIDTDQLVVKNGATIAALFEAGTVFIDNARIHNLTADKISANQIYTRHLLIGDPTNIFPDNNFVDQSVGYSQTGITASDWEFVTNNNSSSPSTNAVKVKGAVAATGGQYSKTFKVDAGTTLFISAFIGAVNDAGQTTNCTSRLYVRWLDSSDALIGSPVQIGGDITASHATLTAPNIVGQATAPATAVSARLYFYRAGDAAKDGAMFSGIEVRRAAPTDMMVDLAASNSSSVFTAGDYDYTIPNPGVEQTIQTLAFTPVSGKVNVKGNIIAFLNSTAVVTCTFRLKRAGVTVQTIVCTVDDIPVTPLNFNYIDTSPGTSSVTWTLTMEPTFPGISGIHIIANHRYLECTNLKK